MRKLVLLLAAALALTACTAAPEVIVPRRSCPARRDRSHRRGRSGVPGGDAANGHPGGDVHRRRLG